MNPSELISGFSLCVDHGLAKSLGVNAAIIYNLTAYGAAAEELIKKPEQLADLLGFINLEEVKEAIDKLLEVGLLKVKS